MDVEKLDVEKLVAEGLYDPGAPNAEDRLALLQYLTDEGATIDEMVESARNGNLTSLVTDQRLQRGALSAADMAERVARAVALERSVISGLAPADGLTETLADEISEHLRALLRDVLCGHLDQELRAVADELLAEAATTLA